jgi:hypothetical protein
LKLTVPLLSYLEEFEENQCDVLVTEQGERGRKEKREMGGEGGGGRERRVVVVVWACNSAYRIIEIAIPYPFF